MVGLSIILESLKIEEGTPKPQAKIMSKANMIKPSPSSPSPNSPHPTHPFSHWKSLSQLPPSPSFLDHCFLCHQKLLPGKDIFMYKGDRAFCSEECRCRQIFMDDNYPLAAMKPQPTSSSSSSSSSTSRKGTKNRANGFAY